MEPITVKYKVLDARAKVPAYATPGAAAADLCAVLDAPLTVAPMQRVLVPTGLAIELPGAHAVALVYARSGLSIKHGLCMANGVGVVDSDYRGELKVPMVNLGAEAYTIQPDGDLELINFAPINGMRGCYVSTDYTDRYLFVAGYHDGKLTVLRLKEDGSIGEITDEIYHKGLGSMAERNFRPHINCARMTHDNKYLLVADQGMDHVNVYRFDVEKGKVKLEDIIRSEMESAPRHIKISEDGKYIYILHELKCYIDVYEYADNNNDPTFEKIQTVELIKLTRGNTNSASAFSFSLDYNYLLSSIAGDNSVIVFDVDKKTGLLKKNFLLPISGEYPKDAEFFPDNKFLVSLNHESNTMTFFHIDLEHGTMIMNGPAMKVNMPNCILFHKLG